MINSYQMISNVNNETVKNVKGKNIDEDLKTANQETYVFTSNQNLKRRDFQ